MGAPSTAALHAPPAATTSNAAATVAVEEFCEVIDAETGEVTWELYEI